MGLKPIPKDNVNRQNLYALGHHADVADLLFRYVSPMRVDTPDSLMATIVLIYSHSRPKQLHAHFESVFVRLKPWD